MVFYQYIVYDPDSATIFHDGSNYQNCAYNETDVEFTNWHCSSPEWGYPVALFAMAIISVPNAVRAGLPTKIAAQWFQPNEYDLANSLTSSADTLGTMITCVVAPFIVKEPSDLSNYQLYFAIPVFISFIGSLFIRQEGYNKDVNKQSFKELVVTLITIHKIDQTLRGLWKFYFRLPEVQIIGNLSERRDFQFSLNRRIQNNIYF